MDNVELVRQTCQKPSDCGGGMEFIMEHTTESGGERISTQNRISARQLIIMGSVAMLSPATQVIPSWAGTMRQAGWTLMLLALPFNLLFVSLLGWLLKRQPTLSLSQLYTYTLGRWPGKVVLFLIGVLVPVALLTVNGRLYGSRIASTIFPFSSETLFIGLTMALSFFITRNSLTRSIRVSNIFFWVSCLMIFLLFVLAWHNIKPGHLLPISPREYGKMATRGFMGLGVSGVFSLTCLLSSHVYNRGSLGRELKRGVLYLTVLLTMVLVFIIGLLNPLTRRSTFSFFSAVKALSIPGVMERLDALSIALWIITDIVLLTLYFMIASQMLGEIFGISDYQRLTGPLHFIVFALAMLISDSQISLAHAMRFIIEPVCLSLVLVSVLVICLVGKLRKKL